MPCIHSKSFLQALHESDFIGSTDGLLHTCNNDGLFVYVLAISTSLQNVGLSPDWQVTSQQSEHYVVVGMLMLLFSLQCCSI